MKFALNVIRSTQVSRSLQELTDVLINSTRNTELRANKFAANNITFKKVEVDISTLFKYKYIDLIQHDR